MRISEIWSMGETKERKLILWFEHKSSSHRHTTEIHGKWMNKLSVIMNRMIQDGRAKAYLRPDGRWTFIIKDGE